MLNLLITFIWCLIGFACLLWQTKRINGFVKVRDVTDAVAMSPIGIFVVIGALVEKRFGDKKLF